VATPLYRIDADHSRFRDIVRGRIRRDLRRFLSSGELIGRCGEKTVSIPLPQIQLPRFRFGDNDEGGEGPGSSGGESKSGQAANGEGGSGAAGEAEGQHILEVDIDLDELAEMLGEELELPNIQPRGRREIESSGSRYTGLRNSGPDSLRHFRRSFKRALLREISSGSWDPDDPMVVPIRDDFRYRARKVTKQPDSSAVVFHMMDVSGSMGREQKEIVRIQAFWIDAWLRKQYRNLEVVYIVHDAAARIVDQHTFFHLRESGGTKISSAYEYRRTGRGGQGITNIDNIGRNGPVVASFPATKAHQLMLVTDQAKLIRMGLDSMRVIGRGSAGVRLFDVAKDEHVVSAALIEEGDEAEGEDADTATENPASEAPSE